VGRPQVQRARVIVRETPQLQTSTKIVISISSSQPWQAKVCNEKVVASPRDSVILGKLWDLSCASTEDKPRRTKISIINVIVYDNLSEIKLKRTDTTLDLSQ